MRFLECFPGTDAHPIRHIRHYSGGYCCPVCKTRLNFDLRFGLVEVRQDRNGGQGGIIGSSNMHHLVRMLQALLGAAPKTRLGQFESNAEPSSIGIGNPT
jgi:hypothetical protein